MFRLIRIEENSPKPIYVQIQDCIIDGIRSSVLSPGSQLPSINEISEGLSIARKTAEKSYNELKRKSIILSVPGKGFFVAENGKLDQKKVLLMFDIMNIQNNLIHRTFMNAIRDHNMVDFLVYHKDINLFREYLTQTPDEYSHYVIMGHFNDQEYQAVTLLNQLPKHKLIILDRQLKGLVGGFSSITQDFANIIHRALVDLKESLKLYKKLCVVFPEFTYYPEDTLNGALMFASESNLSFEVVKDIEQHQPERGNVYLTLTEADLGATLFLLNENQLYTGSDVGVVCYAENPLNRILAGGITTISPNFETMGSLAAQAVLKNQKVHEKIGYELLIRQSL